MPFEKPYLEQIASSYPSILSFDQMNKKKGAGPVAAAPAKAAAAASPKNMPAGKPPSQAPKTNLQDVKKFVQSSSDKKSETIGKGADLKKPAVEPKAIPVKKQPESKEKVPATPQVGLDKPVRKAKDIEES